MKYRSFRIYRTTMYEKICAWSTKRNENGKFHAIIALRDRKLNSIDTKVERFFSVKWKAKTWAWKQYCKEKGIPFTPIHHASPKRQEQGRKLYERLKQVKEIKSEREKIVKKRKIVRINKDVSTTR